MAPSMAGIISRVQSHRSIFDFDKQGLGEELLEIAAEEIEYNLYHELDVEDVPFATLSEKYEAWKIKYFPGKPIGELWGLMKQADNITGERDISASWALMVYGTSEEADLLATWFQEGSEEQNRPERRFYGLTRRAKYRASLTLRAHFQDSI